VRLRGALDAAALERAVEALAQRHRVCARASWSARTM
jgi:DNA-binding MurR/RpiR family transcriptional regulator